jgi:thiamine-phosphate pyrophosphorylase
MDKPQIYLRTPPLPDLAVMPDLLASVLDAAPVACLRLSLASTDADEVRRAADRLREIAHQRDVPVVIDTHLRLVQALGLDGVHFVDGFRQVREARKLLGTDGIVGASCAASRHAGMTAAELTADYVVFGPVGQSGDLGDGVLADHDLFRWWSEMIEVPVVAEGGLDPQTLASLIDVVDFVSLGDEIWNAASGPVAAIKDYARLLG